MTEKELVVELGVEGGDAKIYRTPLDPNGWLFHVEGSTIGIDTNDDIDWQSWAHQPVATIDEALRLIAKGDSWILFYPIAVHSNYKASICGIVQTAASRLPEDCRQSWAHRSHDWQRCCQPE